MRSFSFFFLTLLLYVTSCQKPEEVVPVPPAAEEQLTENEPEVPQKDVKPPVELDSEYFHPARLKNLPYRLLIPRNYDPTKLYPLLVFLHGAGERGTDNEKQLEIGASRFLADSVRSRYPAFIVYPQCPPSATWFDDTVVKQVKELVDTLQRHYAVNPDRMHIGGFSMGAYGTFEIVSQYPGLFDAALAISGDGDKDKVASMAKSRWRIFAGEKDDIVPSVKSEKMAEALLKAGARVSFILYPDANHRNTWVHAFSEPDWFGWLFTEKDPAMPRGIMKN